MTKTIMPSVNTVRKQNLLKRFRYLEMFYLNSTLNLGIPLVLVFQLEAYKEVDRLLTGLTKRNNCSMVFK